jgi:hypothetical protein
MYEKNLLFRTHPRAGSREEEQREKHLWLENTSSPGKKFNGPLHLVPPTFLP